MTNILTVVGSPNPRSFTHALAHVVTQAVARTGDTVAIHDLYAERFPPVAPPEEAYTVGMGVEDAIAASVDPLVREHRRALSEADILVVSHPNWWGKPPAIMAGWIDRTLVPGVAYRLSTGEGLPVPLLRLERLIVLNTGDTPAARESGVFGDPLDLIWRHCVGAYLGSAEVVRLLAGPMSSSTQSQRREWLAEAVRLSSSA